MKDSVAINHQASSAPTVSVVVCTYNRAGLLAGALDALCEQTVRPSEYEVLVVDNNSSDNTRAIAEDFSRRFANLRYCFEPRQGLSHARNRGFREAKGKYVAYIDDDCKAPAEWVAIAKGIIERVSPAAFGGPFYPFYNTEKPLWFQDRYALNNKAEEARPLERHEYLDGMNMAFRKSLLHRLGGFNPDLGMSGNKIAYGEEPDLLNRIRQEMPNELIYHDPKLYVYHLVRPEQMKMRWIVRQRFAHGRYGYIVFHGETSAIVGQHRLILRAARKLMAFGLDLARGVLQRDRTQYPHIQNYLYERSFRYLTTLGKLYEQYHQTRKPPKLMSGNQKRGEGRHD